MNIEIDDEAHLPRSVSESGDLDDDDEVCDSESDVNIAAHIDDAEYASKVAKLLLGATPEERFEAVIRTIERAHFDLLDTVEHFKEPFAPCHSLCIVRQILNMNFTSYFNVVDLTAVDFARELSTLCAGILEGFSTLRSAAVFRLLAAVLCFLLSRSLLPS